MYSGTGAKYLYYYIFILHATILSHLRHVTQNPKIICEKLPNKISIIIFQGILITFILLECEGILELNVSRTDKKSYKDIANHTS